MNLRLRSRASLRKLGTLSSDTKTPFISLLDSEL